VVVPTFNNVENKRHISNIQTIVMQNYQNYRIIVIDDASTDSTGQQIKDYLDRQTKVKATDFTVVINSQNHGSAKNIRRAAF
jgi:glycosyltransferase involved in cell wall biosynthesis